MDIQGFTDYLIFSDGSVWSKKGNRLRKPILDDNGYYEVVLYSGGIRTHKKIHRLIAEHYIPNPYNRPFIHHINRIRTDNRIENLRWVTREETNQNQSLSKKNTSRHKGISHNKKYTGWRYQKMINRVAYFSKYFPNKIDALCYKYIFLLRMKAGHYKFKIENNYV